MSLLSGLFCTVVLAAVIGCGKSATNEGKSKDFADTMAKEHAGDKPTGNNVAWMEPKGEVEGKEVTYTTAAGGQVAGYLATPKGGGKGLPGVIVIHEWWGLNDNIKAMARRIAGEGYMALAVDLYNGNVASVPDSAVTYMKAAMSNPEQGIENIGEGMAFLKKEGASKIGVIGWCFGGGWSLRTALNYPADIDATVIYYGQLVTDPNELKKLEMPVIGFFGGEDQGIPVEQVKQFESTLKSVGVDASINIYPNANHAFANPSGERYNPEAAQDAWKKTTAFLDKQLH